MKYRHDLKIEYPKQTDANMGGTIKHINEVLDDDYPYYDKRPDFLFRQYLFNSMIFVLSGIAVRIRYGLRVKGRKNFWNNRKILRKGTITVCNHVMNWDYFCIQAAIFPQSECVATWKHNVFLPGGSFLRLTGGIPIPDTFGGLRAFDTAIVRILKDKRWLHFYPEGSLWYYYQEVRPFKKGAFQYAVRCNKPVLPLAISYRPAHGIYKLFKKKYPLLTISIGEPIFPDLTIPEFEATEKMRAAGEAAVRALMEANTPDVKEKRKRVHE